MAKRRKAKVRRASTFRSASFRAPKKRRSKSRSSGVQSEIKNYIFGVAYGFSRAYINSGVRNVATKLNFPLANVSDELIMTGVNYGLSSGKIPGIKSIPYSREFGRAGLQGEGVIMGAQLANRMMSRNVSTNNNSQALEQTVFA